MSRYPKRLRKGKNKRRNPAFRLSDKQLDVITAQWDRRDTECRKLDGLIKITSGLMDLYNIVPSAIHSYQEQEATKVIDIFTAHVKKA